ncbi:MAG: hypothetical protein GY953_20965, partial [bacterium]|nr:hypothetical protein [bacterium]
GKQIKLQLPEQEYVKDLAPPLEFRVYRFDLGLKAPSFKSRLIIEPTDSPNQVAAIDYIRLVPRQTRFRGPAGVQFVGKQSDYRNAIYAHTPSSINYEVLVPPGGKLRFGVGSAEAGKPIDFRIRADAGEPLFSRRVSDHEVWQDVEVDLSHHAGDEIKLTFETDGYGGATGLWANPLLISSAPVEKPNVVVYMIDTLRADHT